MLNRRAKFQFKNCLCDSIKSCNAAASNAQQVERDCTTTNVAMSNAIKTFTAFTAVKD